MAKSSNQGWYTFADGYSCWYCGLSAHELKVEVRKHGKIVSFQPN